MLAPEKRKLTLRVNAQLIEEAKEYAVDSHTSVSQLVEAFFRDLSRKRRGDGIKHSPLVEQLTGILPLNTDTEELYGDYLMEKYG